MYDTIYNLTDYKLRIVVYFVMVEKEQKKSNVRRENYMKLKF